MKTVLFFLAMSGALLAEQADYVFFPQSGKVVVSPPSLDMCVAYKGDMLEKLLKARIDDGESQKVLDALEELKNRGLSEEEIEEAKKEVLRKLRSAQRDEPSALLQLENITSEEVLQEISRLQIGFFTAQGEVHVLTQKQLQMLALFPFNPSATLQTLPPVEEEDLEDPFLPPPDQPIVSDDDVKDFLQLHLHDWEKQVIADLIMAIAEKNVFQLLLDKKDMDRKGKKINHVHPLRFIGYICSDPKLKKCIRSFRKNPFKWDHFMTGFAGRMREEAEKKNMLHFIADFAVYLNADPEDLFPFILQADYEGFVQHIVSL